MNLRRLLDTPRRHGRDDLRADGALLGVAAPAATLAPGVA